MRLLYIDLSMKPLTTQLKEFADKHKTQSASQITPASAAAAALVNAPKVYSISL